MAPLTFGNLTPEDRRRCTVVQHELGRWDRLREVFGIPPAVEADIALREILSELSSLRGDTPTETRPDMDTPTPKFSHPLVENDGDTVSAEIIAPEGYVVDEVITEDVETPMVYFRRE